MFVVGMHRAGTSAVTQLLQHMGVYLGAPDDLLPAASDNPHGFFERRDVLSVNQAIFSHHQANWHQVENYHDNAALLPPAISERIRAIIAMLDDASPLWAIKDPRLCFTLPYWLAYSPNALILRVVRHPVQIAQSLWLRNQLPISDGLALWRAYIESALRNTQGRAYVTCDYAALMENPTHATQALHAQLCRFFPALTLPDEQTIHRILAPDLQRASMDAPLTPPQQEIHDQWRV